LKVQCHVTQFVEIGGGYFKGRSFGNHYGNESYRKWGTWDETSFGIGLAVFFIKGSFNEDEKIDEPRYSHIEGNVGFLTVLTIPRDSSAYIGPRTLFLPPSNEMLNIGFDIHLGFIGLSFDFNTLEFIDFLLGWFGIDLFNDDTTPKKKRSFLFDS
jgi:hypothetical protein